MKKKSLIFYSFLLLGVVLFGISIYTSGIDNIIQVLSQFSVLHLIIFVSISFVNFYLYSLRTKIILDAVYPEKKISSWTTFWDRMAAYAVSYVTPVATLGGEPLRIMQLQHEGVPTKPAASSIIIDKTFEIAVLILFISSGILVGSFDSRIDAITRTILGGGGLFLLALVFWFFYTSLIGKGFFSHLYSLLHLKKINRLAPYEAKLNEFEKEMNGFYRKNPKTIIILSIISIFTVLFILMEHFLIAYFMGVRLSFLQAFLTSTIPYFSYLIPIPGGLGALESGHGALFLALGVSINAFAFVFIIRIRDFIFVLMGLLRGWHNGIQILKKEYQDEFKDK